MAGIYTNPFPVEYVPMKCGSSLPDTQYSLRPLRGRALRTDHCNCISPQNQTKSLSDTKKDVLEMLLPELEYDVL